MSVHVSVQSIRTSLGWAANRLNSYLDRHWCEYIQILDWVQLWLLGVILSPHHLITIQNRKSTISINLLIAFYNSKSQSTTLALPLVFLPRDVLGYCFFYQALMAKNFSWLNCVRFQDHLKCPPGGVNQARNCIRLPILCWYIVSLPTS